MTEYEHALQKVDEFTDEDYEAYGSLVGALQYAVNLRPEIAFPVGVGGRCRTFPTRGMYRCMERVLVYAARTTELEVYYTGSGDEARKVRVKADSDWHVRRSTTGFWVQLAMASISSRSHRQHCIAMSSCEAEMMALADASLELLYLVEVLTHIGFEFGDIDIETDDHETHKLYHRKLGDIKHGPVEVGTDSKATYDLCHRTTTGANSRHVERKVFKMRELKHAGKVKVVQIPTEDNSADIFTKVLPNQTFARHRAAIYNLAGKPNPATTSEA